MNDCDGSMISLIQCKIICKINSVAQLFDSLIHIKLTDTFFPFIAKEQHGFVKGRSTLSNLLNLTENVHEAFAMGEQVDVIYTDYAKAFDKLSHSALLYKLKCSGITGSLARWFASYLSNRSQFVRLRNARSRRIFVTSGVPQGSHLGPLLFILFINDLRLYLGPDADYLLFADDMKMFRRVSSVGDCEALQGFLHLLCRYCETFLLRLNLNKCQQITFCRGTNPINFAYSIQGSPLSVVSEIKDLGVVLDSRLNFKNQIEVVKGKAFRMLGYLIRTCKDFTCLNAIKAAYFAIVRSHLDYCSEIWSPTQKGASAMLESVQRRFVRFLYFKGLIPSAPSEYHYNPCLQLLNIRSLQSRRVCSDLILLARIHNFGYGGLSLEPYLREPTSGVLLRSQRLLRVRLNSSSTVNRGVELFNANSFNWTELSALNFSRYRSVILERMPIV